MIQIKDAIHNIEAMRANLMARNIQLDLATLAEKFHKLVVLKNELQELQRESNQIADAVKTDTGDRQILHSQGGALKAQVTEIRKVIADLESELEKEAIKLPNWLAPDVPIGHDEMDNKVVSISGVVPTFDFKAKDHIELGRRLDLIDFEAGAKVTGAKFYFLKNEAVLLQHALKSFVFKKAIDHGFTALQTPDIAKNSILQGVGYAPRGKESNTYELNELDLSLIATAEITVGGMHADEVIEEKSLPLLYVAESHCFRREAGTGGKASKGLYRVHQFEKIELFAITNPNDSDELHQRVLSLQESIYSELKIPYRVILSCSGDLGAPAYKKYDLEAWMPGKGENGEYGEITSASNCTDYQARRLNIKFKDFATKKNRHVHTLNGTASALGRTMLAIIENNQTSNGSIRIPEVLIPYLGFDIIHNKNRSTK